MNRRSGVQTAWFLVAWLAAGAIGRAQNPESPRATAPSPPDVRPAGTEDSIATAKREFDAVKSLREFGSQPKGGLPRMTVPEMPTGSSPALPGQKLKTPDGEKRQSNWLVEAMSKPAPPRSGRESDFRSSEKKQERAEVREDGAKPGVVEGERTERHPSNNPFARFLGDWMTPQDLTLLKPGLEQSFSSDATGRNGGTLAGVGESFALKPTTGLELIGGFESKSRPTGEKPTARENPYLQVFANSGTGNSSMAGPVKPLPALTLPLPAAKGGPPAEFQTGVPPPKSKIPEFVRPVADEKYFKQLKRF